MAGFYHLERARASAGAARQIDTSRGSLTHCVRSGKGHVTMIHKVVVRYKNGTVVKGTTADFAPNRTTFTLAQESKRAGEPIRIGFEDLKAIFFVHSFSGNREYHEQKMRIPEGTIGRRYLLTFTDGETMRGTALGVNLSRYGFLLFPADPGSNNKRIFVMHSAVKELRQEE
jgi:hypothetical protein